MFPAIECQAQVAQSGIWRMWWLVGSLFVHIHSCFFGCLIIDIHLWTMLGSKHFSKAEYLNTIVWIMFYLLAFFSFLFYSFFSFLFSFFFSVCLSSFFVCFSMGFQDTGFLCSFRVFPEAQPTDQTDLELTAIHLSLSPLWCD